MTRHGLLCIAVAMLIPVSLQADIYESTDNEGNPVFSDQPQPDGEAITLPQANIADPVTPVDVAEPSAPASDAHQQPAQPTVIVVPDSHNEEVESQFKSGQRQEVRQAQERREVLEAEKRHEVR